MGSSNWRLWEANCCFELVRLPDHYRGTMRLLASCTLGWRYCLQSCFWDSSCFEARIALARELYTARLEKKVCISQVAQCYHFEFVVDGMESFPYAPGQFISAVAEDPNGKQQTRPTPSRPPPERTASTCASTASKTVLLQLPRRPDRPACRRHDPDPWPHGHFILQEPSPTPSFWPPAPASPHARLHAVALSGGRSRPQQRQRYLLIYGTATKPTLLPGRVRSSRPAQAQLPLPAHALRALPEWTGLRGYVQEHASKSSRSAPTVSAFRCPSLRSTRRFPRPTSASTFIATSAA